MIRSHRLLALVGAAALALSACGEDTADPVATPVGQPAETTPVDDAVTATPQTSEDMTQTGEPADDATVTTEAGTTDSAGTTEDPAIGGEVASGEVPAPGTTVTVGETLTTHVQALEQGEEYYGFATLATTVTDASPADPALFEEAENAEDLAGYVPWYVTAEHEWLTYEGTPNSNMIPSLVAFNAEGGEVSPIVNATWSAGIPGCTVDLPDDKGVGKTATTCDVFAVPESEEIASVGWRGDDYADGGGSAAGNPYYEDPVLWTVD